MARDQGVLSICQLTVKDLGLWLATHEQFPTGQARIDQVAWLPGRSEQAFVTRARDRLALWDATQRGATPLQTLIAGETVRELAIPHTDPHSIACALEGEVRLYDVRSGQTALTLPSRAQLIRWNPFIPYWLATASDTGDSSGIGIHDLRYQRTDPLVSLPTRFTSDVSRTLVIRATRSHATCNSFAGLMPTASSSSAAAAVAECACGASDREQPLKGRPPRTLPMGSAPRRLPGFSPPYDTPTCSLAPVCWGAS